MTQTFGFFDGSGVDYDTATLAAIFSRYLGDGYIPGYLNQLVVSQQVPQVMKVNVATGGANVQGWWHTSDAIEPLTIEAADASQRIDRIVVRLTKTGSPGSVVLAVRKGTAGAAAPAPTRAGATYELVLADITIAPGTTSITSSMITDRRGEDDLCGAARQVAVGKQAYADVAMAGYKMTGCANPVSDQDGDTKSARNAAILIAVPSQAGNTGKYLTTNGTTTSWAPQSAFFVATVTGTPPLVKSSDAALVINESVYTLKKQIIIPFSLTAGGTYRIKFTLFEGINPGHTVYGRIYVNGVAAGTARSLTGAGANQTTEFSEDITIATGGGTTIDIYGYKTGSVSGSDATVSNFRVYCNQEVPW